MKVFCVRRNGRKRWAEFSSKPEFGGFVDRLGDKLEWLWVEVKETSQ